MFDIKLIRENPEAFDAGLKRRGLEPLSAKLLELDDARRRHLTKLQDAQSRRNAASKEIGKAKAQKDEAKAAELMREVADLKEIIQQGEEEERKIDAALAAAPLPHFLAADTAVPAPLAALLSQAAWDGLQGCSLWLHDGERPRVHPALPTGAAFAALFQPSTSS